MKKRYPTGPDDEMIMHLTVRELRLIVWAYGVRLAQFEDYVGRLRESEDDAGCEGGLTVCEKQPCELLYELLDGRHPQELKNWD